MKTLAKFLTVTTVAGALAIAGLQANAAGVTKVTAEAFATTEQKSVSFADLDLTSPQGQATLHARIRSAANAVCGPRHTRLAGSRDQAQRNRECYRVAVSDAMSKVNATAVATTN